MAENLRTKLSGAIFIDDKTHPAITWLKIIVKKLGVKDSSDQYFFGTVQRKSNFDYRADLALIKRKLLDFAEKQIGDRPFELGEINHSIGIYETDGKGGGTLYPKERAA